ncbi:ankyrin repeat domain-containing protein [uncultured Gimesia sp.]|uniref:ankyrin repeat domain-containing protein n=1 Tax=uncultured Gimesia sp. TaxID=1678688 RepID=UPI00262F14AB|nr:ankyrin repeat domain-containing protein [uncultured Gimesia sp.]
MDIFDVIEDHNLQRLEKLLAQGVNPNIPQSDSPTWVPLKSAIEELAEGGPLEAVTLLLRSGADVEGVREPGDFTPLIVAVGNRQLEASLILLAAGADPNARSNEGDTPLTESISNNDKRLETTLRLCGATASFR